MPWAYGGDRWSQEAKRQDQTCYPARMASQDDFEALLAKLPLVLKSVRKKQFAADGIMSTHMSHWTKWTAQQLELALAMPKPHQDRDRRYQLACFMLFNGCSPAIFKTFVMQPGFTNDHDAVTDYLLMIKRFGGSGTPLFGDGQYIYHHELRQFVCPKGALGLKDRYFNWPDCVMDHAGLQLAVKSGELKTLQNTLIRAGEDYCDDFERAM